MQRVFSCNVIYWRVMDHAMKYKIQRLFVSRETFGRQYPNNKTQKGKLQEVRNHIDSFLTVDANYTEKNTHQKYLGQDLPKVLTKCIASMLKPTLALRNTKWMDDE